MMAVKEWYDVVTAENKTYDNIDITKSKIKKYLTQMPSHTYVLPDVWEFWVSQWKDKKGCLLNNKWLKAIELGTLRVNFKNIKFINIMFNEHMVRNQKCSFSLF